MKRTYLVFIFLFFHSIFISQNEAQKWYFGNHCGLDFSTNPPTIVNSPNFNCVEGGASISDPSGNLLFYTDSKTVWDRSHAVMGNGQGLIGNSSTTQSSLIVKQPGSSSIYFVFTLARLFQYSIVDMSLAAGVGSVTTINIPLYNKSCEKLCGVKHCNGSDVWVVTHDYEKNIFRSHLVTSAGVSSTPVLSATGPVYNQDSYTGQAKFSPLGTKLAVARNVAGVFEIYDFNASTGVVSNPLTLAATSQNMYACEFSPDGSKVYASGQGTGMIQWDLCAGDSTAIRSSSVVLNGLLLGYSGSLQLAPNGKIYQASSLGVGINPLAVINHPNLAGAACNYAINAQALGSGQSLLSLPNFVASTFRAPPFDYSVSCLSANFSTTLAGLCTAGESISWDFGDPASGSQNTSSLPQVSHTFLSPGIYTVKLVISSACLKDSTTKLVSVFPPPVSAIPDLSVCAGSSTVLSAGGASTYTWNSTAYGSTFVVSPTVATTYTVAGTDATGCILTPTYVTVNILALPLLNISAPQPVCSGQLLVLSASGAVNYLWSNGSVTGTTIIFPTLTSTYSVTGTDANGCAASTTTSVYIKTPAECLIEDLACEKRAFSVPTAFSPNGDGNNDVFCLQGWDICVKHFSVLVFNRWGEKVFESNDPSFCWDGNYNGKISDPEVYIYTITASFSTGIRVDRRGNITLLK